MDFEQQRSLEEMIFEAARGALEGAGLDRARLDAVVLSGSDQVDGRVISCMPSAGPAGGVGLDVTMIASSGDHALVHGYLRLLAGHGDTVLVVGWAKPSESVSPEHAEYVSAEPSLLRQIGMNDAVAAALQASRWATPSTVDDPVSWPLARADLPARADAVFAAVLAAGDALPGEPLAWISGAGWSTDRYELGDRDLAELTSLHQAVRRLPGHAAPGTWGAVEIAAPSEPAVRAVASALGLPPGARVNASGSLTARPAPAHVAGLSRLLAAARLAGEAGVAAGIGLHGFAAQGATVMVFGKERP